MQRRELRPYTPHLGQQTAKAQTDDPETPTIEPHHKPKARLPKAERDLANDTFEEAQRALRDYQQDPTQEHQLRKAGQLLQHLDSTYGEAIQNPSVFNKLLEEIEAEQRELARKLDWLPY